MVRLAEAIQRGIERRDRVDLWVDRGIHHCRGLDDVWVDIGQVVRIGQIGRIGSIGNLG